MFVRMLTSMAGADFSYVPGETVAVENTIGKAWVDAGIAEKATDAAASAREAKALAAEVATLTAQLADVTADRDALRDQTQVLAAQVETLNVKLTAASAPPPDGAQTDLLGGTGA